MEKVLKRNDSLYLFQGSGNLSERISTAAQETGNQILNSVKQCHRELCLFSPADDAVPGH